ncbi:MAG: hypothetical protein VYE73_14010 [Acidobacteriota bacterium]|nr:hypothetical protein [Acidobacteriota bacterium]
MKIPGLVKRVGLGVVGLVVVAYLTVLVSFQVSKRARLGALRAGSQVVETAAGPIEGADHFLMNTFADEVFPLIAEFIGNHAG